ncbi:hypothetical protein BE20_00825 [Sorangium cellulosum]|uniref:Uncharacterized protein n=1 Tax=Sorangium cellulosum TaxID=56 RepID=A0A150SP54_SORCE|nr:hypothetical protein BE18_18625 [Sorangium cellulosum]KYF94232.1 hypothetical protein BE20_00825 [Sorangium cellulosum]
MNDTKATINALAKEFRELREVRGHFSGGPWNDAVDKWGGRKQVVMGILGTKLGDGAHTKAEVVALLGEPDEIVAAGTPAFRRFARTPAPHTKELLVYHWRGDHDVLFFASDGTTVLSVGHWGAKE